MEEAWGFCQIHEDEDNVYSPKSFKIDVSSEVPLLHLLETIAHEMVHLKQFRNMELKYREKFTMFQGVTYSLDTPYSDEPWEQEAYSMEEVLVNMFIDYYLENNKE